VSASETFMDMLKDNVQRIGPEISSTLEHHAGRGATELANALFGGQAFVLYGHGNSHPANVNQLGNEQEQQTPEAHQQQDGHEQSRGRGM
jgi:hypothetical protein